MKQKTQRGYEPVNIIFKISQIYAICNGYRQKLRKKAQNKEKQPVTKHPCQYWPNSS